MSSHLHPGASGLLLAAMAGLALPNAAHADVVTDANARAAAIASKVAPTPVAARAMAIVQVSVFEAVNAITQRYPPLRARLDPAPGASVEAAVAAATHAALARLVPDLGAASDADYHAALAGVTAGPAREAGIALGERAAAAILEQRADDGALAPSHDAYRPVTTPGQYVPTTLPAVPHWGRRHPWVMVSGDQFRPAPPPGLTSEVWTRDYNESRAVGVRTGSTRTPDQTAIARFWEATAPALYWPVACCVADQPGREITANARLLALAGMAMDDAFIAVFDAKYEFNFWRPITAIRNGDLDGNEATERDPRWTPLIETPMHPEYPCAHCIVSGALGAILEAELGSGATPRLRTTSPTAAGAERSWVSVDEFEREVAEARILDGVHFRNSTEVGTAMGRTIGALVARSAPDAR